MPADSLYDRLLAAGFELDHHESDLYVPVTPESRAIIDAWLTEQGYSSSFVTTFTSQIDGKPHFDVPFAYQPFWNAKGGKPVEEEEAAPSMGM